MAAGTMLGDEPPGGGTQVELATATWVDWYNRRRLHGAIGGIPPAEFEELYRRQLEASDAA